MQAGMRASQTVSGVDRAVLLKAAALMSLGMLFIPIGDTAGKLMSAEGVAPIFVAWSRFTLGAGLVFLVMRGRAFDFSILRNWRIWLRAALITSAVSSILTALSTEPIANVFAAFFIGPILSYFLSAWLLRETITLPRTILLFIGFCGVLLVVRPGMDLSIGMCWALLAGMFYGAFLVATKWLVTLTNPRSLLFSHLFIGGILMAPWGVAAVPEMTVPVSGLVLMSAAASATGNLLHTIATRMADASRLAPLVYVQLVSATVMGVAVFGDWPDRWSLAGLALLLGSGFGAFFLRNAR